MLVGTDARQDEDEKEGWEVVREVVPEAREGVGASTTSPSERREKAQSTPGYPELANVERSRVIERLPTPASGARRIHADYSPATPGETEVTLSRMATAAASAEGGSSVSSSDGVKI